MTETKYRYVGGESIVDKKLYNRIGQPIEFNPRGMGVAVITEEQFNGIFTDAKELVRFGLVHAREAAPPAFIDKLKKAWALVDHELIYAEPVPVDLDPVDPITVAPAQEAS